MLNKYLSTEFPFPRYINGCCMFNLQNEWKAASLGMWKLDKTNLQKMCQPLPLLKGNLYFRNSLPKEDNLTSSAEENAFTPYFIKLLLVLVKIFL